MVTELPKVAEMCHWLWNWRECAEWVLKVRCSRSRNALNRANRLAHACNGGLTGFWECAVWYLEISLGHTTHYIHAWFEFCRRNAQILSSGKGPVSHSWVLERYSRAHYTLHPCLFRILSPKRTNMRMLSSRKLQSTIHYRSRNILGHTLHLQSCLVWDFRCNALRNAQIRRLSQAEKVRSASHHI